MGASAQVQKSFFLKAPSLLPGTALSPDPSPCRDMSAQGQSRFHSHWGRREKDSGHWGPKDRFRGICHRESCFLAGLDPSSLAAGGSTHLLRVRGLRSPCLWLLGPGGSSYTGIFGEVGRGQSDCSRLGGQQLS